MRSLTCLICFTFVHQRNAYQPSGKATEMTKIIYNGKIILTNTLLTPQYYIYLSLHIQRFYQIKMQQKQ